MKKIFSILYLTISMPLYAQGNLLSGYNFDNGDYVLYGLPLYSESNKTIIDSLDRWYISDNQVIKQVAGLWKLEGKPQFDLYSNNYDYEILLYKNKICVETFFVNSQNWILYHKNKSYYFGPQYLRLIYRKTNQQKTFFSRIYFPYDSTQTYHREDYDSAVAFFNSSLKDPNILFIMRSNIPYGELEGNFVFSYKLQKSDMSTGIDDIVNKLKKLISSIYKTDKFYIEFAELSEGQLSFYLYCDKKLFDNFQLFPILDWKDNGETWEYQTYRTTVFPVDQNRQY
jgi:hypothetical protein